MQFDSFLKKQAADVSLFSANAVLQLVGEGATVPFMARYRKEKTGNLDEVQIRAVIDAKEKWDEILKRQEFITGEIAKQDKLTEALKKTIQETFDLDRLEDLYLPFKLKRKTKAVLAKEAGLEPLALWMIAHSKGEASDLKIASAEELAIFVKTLLNPEKKIDTELLVLQGAIDIVSEQLSENSALRERVRQKVKAEGFLKTKKGAKAKTPSKFENYFEFSESILSLMEPKSSHRYLALRRGWMEEELGVSLTGAPNQEEAFEAELLSYFEKEVGAQQKSLSQVHLLKAARNALKIFVMPSIETEFHRILKESADAVAITVFSENVRNLLLSSPYGAKAVLAVDPGIRTGCKLAIINSSGQYVASTVIHTQTPMAQKEAKNILLACIKEASISAIAVGNGTAGRETEAFIRETLKEAKLTDIHVVMVNESGASIYSASDVAREEFPDLDVTVRGAISIARRFQDPLAELVKIDPKSIGVGQYQHDVSQPQLKKSIDSVVDSCVNYVGVDLNTASPHLLGRVSGIGPSLAKGIIEFRVKKGAFKNRAELLEVPRFSKKAYEQAAGFLRIRNADNPLDNTGVHPEKYEPLEKLAIRLGKQVKDLLGDGVGLIKSDSALKAELGEFTFKDIVQELEKPGRDPRETFVPFQFREDIHDLKDLKEGMSCPGIVTNVTNFGAFVDIGVHQDGLVHISQISDRFVKDPKDVVKPGDHVTVRVLEVNLEKKQIALSMKSENAPRTESRASTIGSGARPPVAQPGRPFQQPNLKNKPEGRPPSSQSPSRENRPAFRGNDRNQSVDSRPQGSGNSRPSEFRNNAFSQFGDLAKALGSAPVRKNSSKP